MGSEEEGGMARWRVSSCAVSARCTRRRGPWHCCGTHSRQVIARNSETEIPRGASGRGGRRLSLGPGVFH